MREGLFFEIVALDDDIGTMVVIRDQSGDVVSIGVDSPPSDDHTDFRAEWRAPDA